MDNSDSYTFPCWSRSVSMNVLLVGRTHDVLDSAESELTFPDLHLEAATTSKEVTQAFAKTSFAHVFMGAGIELEERLAVVRAVYDASETATIHLKDVATGPEGFLPFVKAILSALP